MSPLALKITRRKGHAKVSFLWIPLGGFLNGNGEPCLLVGGDPIPKDVQRCVTGVRSWGKFVPVFAHLESARARIVENGWLQDIVLFAHPKWVFLGMGCVGGTIESCTKPDRLGGCSHAAGDLGGQVVLVLSWFTDGDARFEYGHECGKTDTWFPSKGLKGGSLDNGQPRWPNPGSDSPKLLL